MEKLDTMGKKTMILYHSKIQLTIVKYSYTNIIIFQICMGVNNKMSQDLTTFQYMTLFAPP